MPAEAPRRFTSFRIAAGLGFLAFAATFLTLGGPGITIDEPLDVRPGRTYVETLQKRGWKFFEPDVVNLVFRDNSEHPPLGRWLLGIATTLAGPFETWLPGGPDPFGVHAARIAPAAAFGLLVLIISHTAGGAYGRPAGMAAGLALMMMPRVFAHAHLAALDTFVGLTWTSALLAADRALRSKHPVRGMTLAGFVLGMALLTKIHAWFLLPIIPLWSFVRLRPRTAIVACSAWASIGFATYFVGWPWLWTDSRARLAAYLGTGVDRIALRVQYFGQVYLDREVPWHYPWFYFAATVPVGLHLLGLIGLGRGLRGKDDGRKSWLLAGSIATFLVVFSTKIPVYDGERLFLLVFPLWAIFIGMGFGACWMKLSHPSMKIGLALFFAAQGYGVVALHPFGLSYYNAIVGGLPGAERWGLELTYWGDAVDPALLDNLATQASPGQSAALVPSLHHIQPIASLTPALVARKVTLAEGSTIDTAKWVVAFRRDAYLPERIRSILASDRIQPAFENRRQGIRLSAIYRTPLTDGP